VGTGIVSGLNIFYQFPGNKDLSNMKLYWKTEWLQTSNIFVSLHLISKLALVR